MAADDAGLDDRLLQAVPKRSKPVHTKKSPALRLYHWKELPDYLQDNEFIYTGYRANLGLWGSLRSLFRFHNESGNVWSHLSGFVLFIVLLVYIIYSPPTPLAMRRHDLENLWDAVAARIHNASDSVKHQIHHVNTLLHQHDSQHSACPAHGHGRQADPFGSAARDGGTCPERRPTASLFTTLGSLQHKLVDAVHGMESSLERLSSNLTQRLRLPRLPHVPGRLQSSLSSVQHSLHDGLGTVQHTLHDGLGSLVSGVALPEGVTNNVRQLGRGVRLSLGQLAGAVRHNFHSLEDFVMLRFNSSQGGAPHGLASNVEQTFHWMRDALDDMLHGVVLSSVHWPVPRWPLYTFMAGAMTCLLVSSVAHLFSCCNKHSALTIWRFDYAGIVANIVSSFYPSVYYCFMCQPVFQWVYLVSISSFGAVTLALSLLECFQTTEWRSTRASSFAILGLLGIVPYVHVLLKYPHFEKMWDIVFIDLCMAACYLAGAAIYALRVPERWAPGRFDYVLHSHQIFHLFVVAGAFCHYLSVTELLQWRDASGGCALEAVDRAMLAQARNGGDGLVDVHAVLEYLQHRFHEYFHIPHPAACQHACVRDTLEGLFSLEDHPTCPWVK